MSLIDDRMSQILLFSKEVPNKVASMYKLLVIDCSRQSDLSNAASLMHESTQSIRQGNEELQRQGVNVRMKLPFTAVIINRDQENEGFRETALVQHGIRFCMTTPITR